MLKRLIAALYIFALMGLTGCATNTREISVAEYQDKVYASWVAQCVGNMYGLAHEFKYKEEPRTEPITGWDPGSIQRIREVNGAFSDDDTDIEYVDLFVMEKYGPEPTYENLAEFWKLCINDHIWVANREARTLMDESYLPPLTGRRDLNLHWYQIDPQLVCEIWAVTAPGMLDYAAAKADWAAKVTNDDYGTHPTIWYNTMYAAAFFEKDVEKLCQIGYDHVPEGSPFRMAIDDVRRWKAEYGDDWVTVRKHIKEKYNDRKDLDPAIQTGFVSALLNGALGVLALLYGEGDFEQTMNYACMAGYDADNQCATLAGLVGIMHGFDAIPHKYTFVLEEWEKPLNDIYHNRTRDHLPHGTITDISSRTAALGIQLVEMHGGSVKSTTKGDVLKINTDAQFTAPLEARLFPIHIYAGDKEVVSVDIIGGKPGATPKVSVAGVIPEGMVFIPEGGNHTLVGIPEKQGEYDIQVAIKEKGKDSRTTKLKLFVHKRNHARHADRIIAAVTKPTGGGSPSLEVLRDRMTTQHYDSFDGLNQLERDFYGYEWKEPVTINKLQYTVGSIAKNGGWFETMDVEYKNDAGEWTRIEEPKFDPGFTIKQARRDPNTFVIKFDDVVTTGIRIIGKPGGEAQFTSIRELSVHQD